MNIMKRILRKQILLVVCSVLILPYTLLAQSTGKITGVIRDAKTSRGLEYSKVLLLGTKFGAIANDKGEYTTIDIPVGEYKVSARMISYRQTTKSITVVADQTVTLNLELAEDLIQMEEVVVTGTRRREGERVVTNSPVPVDVVSSKEMKQSGYTETSQMLQMMIPSFNFQRPSVADGTDNMRPPSLRSLSPDQVLVLINGKRRHSSALLNVNNTIGHGTAAVDLNAIPSAMIERIEVLRDGAAAQYGSDAIAGVINIILKSDPSVNFGVLYGQNAQNVYTAAGVTPPAGKSSIGDGMTVNFDFNGGTKIGKDGYFTFGGEFRFKDSSNRTHEDWRRQYGLLPSGVNDAKETNFNRYSHWVGDTRTIGGQLFFNSRIPISENVSFYMFGGGNYRNGVGGGFYRLENANNTRTIVNGAAVPYFYPNGFLPIIRTQSFDASFHTGIEATVDGWVMNLGVGYGYNHYIFGVENSLNVSLGTSSPKSVWAGSFGYGQGTFNFDVNKLFEYGVKSLSPLSASAGLEARIENYTEYAGEEASYVNGGYLNPSATATTTTGASAGASGIQVFPGFTPNDAKSALRQNVSAYLDFEQGFFNDMLSLGAAGRFEYYSTFGANVNGKVAVRIEPIKGFGIRGAASSGFRSPSLMQENFTSIASNITAGQVLLVGTFTPTSSAAKALGASALTPEKSLNFSGGITVEPIENLSITADYFYISIIDRIVMSSTYSSSVSATGVASGPVATALTAAGVTGVTSARFLTNAVDTKTNGVDVVARYAIDFGMGGVLKLTGTFNYTINEITNAKTSSSALAALGTPLFDLTQRVRIEKGQPLGNFNFMVNYDVANFSFIVKLLSFGEYTAALENVVPATATAVPGTDFTKGSYVAGGVRYADISDLSVTYPRAWTADVELAYTLKTETAGKYRFAVGANNVLNIYPMMTPTRPGNTSDGFYIPYDRRANPFGMTGAYIYGKINITL